ncbi:hypothetical protein GOARA_089_00500 [Gordonia araii NBRC 100433]|uniref:SAV-6107-like HEPN domain-containing protein n=1 Tax=Gordonia araii NBRC 100433 TaxID=1073574 RepID=G7H7P2_9ACTN|nr:SAV_6107 family HEPN domain-containing protein [Gordonia araii]NNG97847.1 hypothetical protein [Gordonia araii NBRC 100433]GAB11867.1 hypothetical protein GOARA_089_00500 [Gordonia araii NBRC 100433]
MTTGNAIETKVVVDAHRLLDQAIRIADDGDLVADRAERYRLYYLAALRTAGAALAVLESRRRAPRGQRNAWVRLGAQGSTAPESGVERFADFFAAHSVVRQRIETGLVHDVEQAAVARLRVGLTDFIATTESILADYEQGKASSESRTA